MSHSSETRWKAGAPVEGLSETLVELSAQRASDAELARLEERLAAQLAAPTRSGSGGAGSWLSLGRSWPWLSVLVIGLAATWPLMPRREVAEPRVPVAQPALATPAAPAAIAAAPVAQAEPPPSEVAPVVKSPAKRVAHAAELKPVAPVSAEAELALLRKAQSALNRSARAALTIADEHAQRYPNGLFVQEREMLRIEAELTLGKRREALERAHAFSERFGSSTYRARIDRLLEAHRSLKKQETPEPERTH